jgi:hypothetical protein
MSEYRTLAEWLAAVDARVVDTPEGGYIVPIKIKQPKPGTYAWLWRAWMSLDWRVRRRYPSLIMMERGYKWVERSEAA